MKLNDISKTELEMLYKKHKTLGGVKTALKTEYGVITSVPTLSRRLGKGVKRDTEEATTEVKPAMAGGYTAAPDKARRVLSGQRFVVTSAQNNTYVHAEFLAAILNYCDQKDAQLLVSPFTYNKSGWHQEEDTDDLWYDPSIMPYMIDESAELAPGLVLCGELDILPTAIFPMSGMQSYTKQASCIIPHAKLQMESVATAKDAPAKLMYTTGAITLRNYIQKKSGQKAEFHHIIGALVVEVDDDGDWFVRQVVVDSEGGFYDLNEYWTGIQRVMGTEVTAISFGDIHAEKIDHTSVEVCFGQGGLRDTLNPSYQFLHDTTDFMSRNHHNKNDAHFLAEMYYADTTTVQGNMQAVARFLHGIKKEGTATVIVESNHDQAFEMWLKDGKAHYDAPNSLYWHEYNYKLLSAVKYNRKFKPFEEAVNSEYEGLYGTRCTALFLHEDESCVVDNVELGAHGHRGPNGSRGNPRNHRNLGSKYTTGHTHSAGIIDGVYTSGVLGKLDMGYNKGPSSWSHSHTVQYKNGKRAIITQRGAKWRA